MTNIEYRADMYHADNAWFLDIVRPDSSDDVLLVACEEIGTGSQFNLPLGDAIAFAFRRAGYLPTSDWTCFSTTDGDRYTATASPR